MLAFLTHRVKVKEKAGAKAGRQAPGSKTLRYYFLQTIFIVEIN
jgi:hypothetical protein